MLDRLRTIRIVGPMLRYIACLAATTIVAHSAEWYEEMQLGPAWSNTFKDTFQGAERVAAKKGILLDLGGGYHALFDTETLRLVTAYDGKWQWGGTPWTGEHGNLVKLADQNPVFNTVALAGWANAAGSFEDNREIPGYGNFKHASFKGFFRNGDKITLNYSVNGTEVLETVSREGKTITRSFKIDKRGADLLLGVADEKGDFTVANDMATSADGLSVTSTGGVKLAADPNNAGRLIAKFPKGDAPAEFQIALGRDEEPKPAAMPDFAKLVTGGAPLWPEIIETKGVISTDTEVPYATDIVTLPIDNPWKANLRFGGFDFLDDDSAALSSWNGDVWVVRGLQGDWKKLKWQRIASGLFEPLGVKAVDGKLFVNGRDQITQLIDLNGDGAIDYFKVFNRDMIVSENFHEFSFELQTDKAGNFYISKAAPVRGGGRGFDRILPNHGTIMKITPDGSKLEVIATGLRAPGGLGVGPNGEITSGENEGTNQPCCKINYMNGDVPKFFGTEASRQFLTDAEYTEPICYLPMAVDNSGGSQVWVPEGSDFGIPAGTMLHLSYGQSCIYEVLTIPRGDGLQGGVVKLPITLQSSAMRARFQDDGSLYVLGFRGWQTNAATEVAFQRVRHNPGVTVPVPTKLAYTDSGIRLTFPVKLDQELAEDVSSYSAERWNYVRGPQYGSGEFSVDHPDLEAEKLALEKESKDHHVHDTVEIESAQLLPDGKTVEIGLAGMKPAMTLEVTYDLEDSEGEVIQGQFDGTVYGK